MHNVTHILLWRHCDSKSFTVVLVGGQRLISFPNNFLLKILNDFILWVMFLKANTCIPSFCESKILTELRFRHQRVVRGE